MYEQIKRLADEALALQNKDSMDAALREISALCAREVAKISEGISPKSLWPATKAFYDAKYTNDLATMQSADDMAFPFPRESSAANALTEVAASSFGLAHIKQEGCAVHPDDISAPMSAAQEARQLAAYERDVAAGGPVSAGEGDDQ